MNDPFAASKRDLEERDRIRFLADDARAILNRLDGWREWPHEEVIRYLMAHHSFRWADAAEAIAYIDWDDDHEG